MSVTVGAERIVLAGNCPVDEAETLLIALQEDGTRGVDLAGAARLHTAVLQVLIASRARIVAAPPDPFLRRHVLATLMVEDSGSA